MPPSLVSTTRARSLGGWGSAQLARGALDEDDLADVLHVAALELDFVCAGLVGHAVDGALEDAGAEVLALQPDLGTCDRKQI
jgi:hypothetical protein